MSTMPDVCQRCRRKIYSRECRIQGKTYHSECFTCALCAVNLDSTTLVDAPHLREVYCRECRIHYFNEDLRSLEVTMKTDKSAEFRKQAGLRCTTNMAFKHSFMKAVKNFSISTEASLSYRSLHGTKKTTKDSTDIFKTATRLYSPPIIRPNTVVAVRSQTYKRTSRKISCNKSRNLLPSRFNISHSFSDNKKCKTIFASRPQTSTASESFRTSVPEVRMRTANEDLNQQGMKTIDQAEKCGDVLLLPPNSESNYSSKSVNETSTTVMSAASWTSALDIMVHPGYFNDYYVPINDIHSAMAMKLPATTVPTVANKVGKRNEILECSICFVSLHNDDNEKERKLVVVTLCGHLFHEKCIKDWLKKHKRCPICCSLCDEEYLLTVYLQAGVRRGASQSNMETNVSEDCDELAAVHAALLLEYQELKNNYKDLLIEHEFCSWKCVIIDSFKAAYDWEYRRRSELEKEYQQLQKKIEVESTILNG